PDGKTRQPTTGHRTRRMVHSARPLSTPHSSLTSKGRSGARCTPMASGERKENLLQRGRSLFGRRTKLVERADAAHSTGGEQHETVTDAFGVGELMDRQHQRASTRRHA